MHRPIACAGLLGFHAVLLYPARGLFGGIAHADFGSNLSGNYSAPQTKGSAARPNAWFAEPGWTGELMDAGKTAVAIRPSRRCRSPRWRGSAIRVLRGEIR